MNAGKHKFEKFGDLKMFNLHILKIHISIPSTHFEFQEQFIIGVYLITLTQFEKTGSIFKILIPQGT